MKAYLLFFILGIFILCACQKEEQKSELAVLSTGDVSFSGSTENGVELSATILLESQNSILEYGFVYDLESKPNLNISKIVKMEGLETNHFSAKIEDALVPDTTYYVRSFVRTDEHLIYGNEVTFYSNGSKAPVIEKIEPAIAFWGDTIMITGENFDYSGRNNKVFFNQFEAEKLWGSNDTIYAIVPIALDVKESELSVSLYGKQSATSKSFEVYSPVINSISSDEGQHPDTILIKGQYFSNAYGQLLFGNNKLNAVSISKDEIKFKVPFLGDAQTLDITYEQLNELLPVKNQFQYNEQKIIGVSNDSIYIGDEITLYGKNIDFRRADIITLGESNWNKGERWQDSMRLLPSSLDQYSSEFVVSCQVEDIEPRTLKTIYHTFIKHLKPKITEITDFILPYRGTIEISAKGTYGWCKIHYQGIDKQDIIGSIATRNRDRWQHYAILDDVLVPGKYKVWIESYSRYSDKVDIEIAVPKISSINNSSTYKRGDVIDFQGEYLPNDSRVYKVLHVESGYRYPTDVVINEGNSHQWNLSSLFGEGTYQLEIHFGKEIYTYPGTIVFEDIFQLMAQGAEYTYFDNNTSFAFVADQHFYSKSSSHEVYNYSIDLISGERYSLLESFYPGANQCKYPLLFEGNFYTIFDNQVYQFSSEGGVWINEGYNFNTTTLCMLCEIENELFAFSSDGEVFKKSNEWNAITNIDMPDYFYPRYADYYDGNIYFWDCVNYRILKFSVNEWVFADEFTAPVKYSGGLKEPQHIFTYQNDIYLCYMKRGVYYTSFLKFSPVNEEYSFVDGGSLPGREYHYRFAPDELGNVYMYRNNAFYKFNP